MDQLQSPVPNEADPVAAPGDSAAPSRRQLVVDGLSLLSAASIGAMLAGCGERNAPDGSDATATAHAAAAEPAISTGATAAVAPVLPLLPQPGDAFQWLMAYAPDRDGDAVYVRSTVPLAPRIASWRYDIVRHTDDGRRDWIGRIGGSAFYTPTALPAGTGAATIAVQPIGFGQRGAPVRIQV